VTAKNFRRELFPEYKANRDARLRSELFVVETSDYWIVQFFTVQSKKKKQLRYTKSYIIIDGPDRQFDRALTYFRMYRDGITHALENGWKQPNVRYHSPLSEPTKEEYPHAWRESGIQGFINK